MTSPVVNPSIKNSTEAIMWKTPASPARKYHIEYVFHITPFSLLYYSISVIFSASTSVPDQNHMGF